jgi:EmrB/QacA subfamily drug resistance transporter
MTDILDAPSDSTSFAVVRSPIEHDPMTDPEEPVPESTFRWGPLLVTLTATLMTSLDVFIVNVALPSMQRDLRAGSAAVQWVVAGFSLAVGAGVITGGRLGDRFGRRRMFALGMALFTVMSAACGLATSPGLLVAGRVAQGVAAALMSPQVLAILQTTYRGSHLSRALGAYGLTLGLGAVLGQVIGGVLIRVDPFGLGWRSCFLINVPVGAVALLLTRRMVPKSAGSRGAGLDLVGAFLVTLALLATVVPLIEGRTDGWPAWTGICFASAVVLFVVFACQQRWRRRIRGASLIDLALFRQATFSLAIVTQIAFWMGMASFFLVFALYVQQGIGLDPLQAGLVFTVMGAGYLAASLVAPRLMARWGHQVVGIGSATMILGQIVLVAAVGRIGGGGGPVWLVPGLLIDGAGMGLALGPITTITLSQVAPRHAGMAAGIVSTVMQVAGALGVAVVGVVYFGALGNAEAAPRAFEHALYFLVAVACVTGVLVQLVPGRSRAKGRVESGAGVTPCAEPATTVQR